MKRLLLLFAIAISACATAADTRGPTPLAKALAGRVAGETRECVGFASASRSLDIIDANTLIYRESGKRVWRNDLRDGCPGLDRDDILVLEPFGNQYCRNDRVRAIDRTSGFPHSFCLLGSFTAYDKVKARSD